MRAADDRPGRDARRRGSAIEARAETWLSRHGLTPLSRNYTCRGGEIDLVMEDGDTLVFVEVRYRASSRYGSAAESIDARKRARIVRAAREYVARHRGAEDRACRFDVVAVDGDGDALRADWIAGAFSA